MRLTIAAVTTGFAVVIGTLAPGQAVAEAKIYPYHGANYCPAGLQPVTVGGVICCGKPNQHISYSQAMAHPQKKRNVRKHRYSARAHCPAGSKGCS